MRKSFNILVVCLSLIFTLSFPQFAYATINPNTVMMYRPDNGRIVMKEVNKSDCEAFKKEGWYDEPITYIYSLDSQGTVVTTSKANDMIKSGEWYEYPVLRLYAPDGRTMVIYQRDILRYTAVGWYTEPMTIMYSQDGQQTKVVPVREIETNEKAGWQRSMPTVTMYSWDGTRTQIVPITEVEQNEAVGWCYGKPVRMYADGGKEMIVGEQRVELYKSLNWSTEPFVKVYTIMNGYLYQGDVPADHIAPYIANGWTITRPKANYQFNLQTAKNVAYGHLKKLMKRPSTLEIYSVNAYDSTASWQWDSGCIEYTITYDCSAMNGFGGYSRSIDVIKIVFNTYTGDYTPYYAN